MNRQEYLTEFEKQYYEPVTTEFVHKTAEYLMNNNLNIIERITTELESFMEKVAKMQKVQPIAAGLIAISVMRTGIWSNKPMLRFDCYDEGKEAGRNIAYQYVNADFIVTEWESYRKALEKAVKQGGYERYIREAQIECYMSRAIERLIMLLFIQFKYYLADADYLKHFNELLIEEGFLITIGEYMDWQKILFAKVPEIDIIANPKEQPLMFQKIEEKKYRGQRLENMDLTQARFKNCEFSKCVFDNIVFNDVRFVNCLFRNVEMLSGTMYGATFIDCIFENVNMDGMETKYIPDMTQPVRLDNIYREVSYIECIMDGKRME